MVTITVKDQETDQKMNLEITGTPEDANVNVTFNPPIKGNCDNMWGKIAQTVLNSLVNAK